MEARHHNAHGSWPLTSRRRRANGPLITYGKSSTPLSLIGNQFLRTDPYSLPVDGEENGRSKQPKAVPHSKTVAQKDTSAEIGRRHDRDGPLSDGAKKRRNRNDDPGNQRGSPVSEAHANRVPNAALEQVLPSLSGGATASTRKSGRNRVKRPTRESPATKDSSRRSRTARQPRSLPVDELHLVPSPQDDTSIFDLPQSDSSDTENEDPIAEISSVPAAIKSKTRKKHDRRVPLSDIRRRLSVATANLTNGVHTKRKARHHPKASSTRPGDGFAHDELVSHVSRGPVKHHHRKQRKSLLRRFRALQLVNELPQDSMPPAHGAVSVSFHVHDTEGSGGEMRGLSAADTSKFSKDTNFDNPNSPWRSDSLASSDNVPRFDNGRQRGNITPSAHSFDASEDQGNNAQDHHQAVYNPTHEIDARPSDDRVLQRYRDHGHGKPSNRETNNAVGVSQDHPCEGHMSTMQEINPCEDTMISLQDHHHVAPVQHLHKRKVRGLPVMEASEAVVDDRSPSLRQERALSTQRSAGTKSSSLAKDHPQDIASRTDQASPPSVPRNRSPQTVLDSTTHPPSTEAGIGRNSIRQPVEVVADGRRYLANAIAAGQSSSRQRVAVVPRRRSNYFLPPADEHEVEVERSDKAVPETSQIRAHPMTIQPRRAENVLRQAEAVEWTSSIPLKSALETINLKTLTRQVSREHGTLCQGTRRIPSFKVQRTSKQA